MDFLRQYDTYEEVLSSFINLKTLRAKNKYKDLISEEESKAFERFKDKRKSLKTYFSSLYINIGIFEIVKPALYFPDLARLLIASLIASSSSIDDLISVSVADNGCFDSKFFLAIMFTTIFSINLSISFNIRIINIIIS